MTTSLAEKPRRSYGTGGLFVRADRSGRQTWYGKWRTNGRQIKRRIGPKRGEGSRDGLTRTQAEAELRRLIAETPGAARVGERLTMHEAGRRYTRYLAASGRKPSTLAAVRGHLAHWIEPFFADRAIDGIRTEDVADLVTLMQAGQRPGGLRRTKPLSPKTIRNAIGTLNALMSYAQRKGWTGSNPVLDLELPVVEPDEDIRFLEPVEVEAVGAAATSGTYEAVDRALYITAAMTGLRQGELIALRWRDVDWTAGRIRVRQNYVLGEFGTPKSRRSTRSVPMADRVAGELDSLFKASSMQGDDDLVFADPLTGGPLAKAAILRRFRKALRVARLDDAHVFHDLRHTFGTRMAAAGVPMRTLQEWMGHRDIATTQRYADYAPAPEHEAALIAGAFRSSSPIVSAAPGVVSP
ncbi:tyrosine-type recombinase/integrase [Capillimicrobium parvum]|uniref:Tyrosine recombinase XerC n=1 Tax=Capillimicrobium parvum TaxID=2884022 RepID=A0A9E7C049_9ACTN|nr:site-specific integrase [Capillimicrobium parvum]UGS35249.1 Tyrosine recombinase XerC [Capillimicrobium parvum]